MDPRGLDNPTSLDTFSTDLHPDHLFIMEDPYRLEIRLPNPFSPIVGMAYIIPPLKSLPAYFTNPGHPGLPFMKFTL